MGLNATDPNSKIMQDYNVAVNQAVTGHPDDAKKTFDTVKNDITDAETAGVVDTRVADKLRSDIDNQSKLVGTENTESEWNALVTQFAGEMANANSAGLSSANGGPQTKFGQAVKSWDTPVKEGGK